MSGGETREACLGWNPDIENTRQEQANYTILAKVGSIPQHLSTPFAIGKFAEGKPYSTRGAPAPIRMGHNAAAVACSFSIKKILFCHDTMLEGPADVIAAIARPSLLRMGTAKALIPGKFPSRSKANPL